MGQKVNPKVHRLGVIRSWNSKWFSHRNYIPQLRQDQAIRKFLYKKLREAGVAEIDIERGPAKLTINLHVARPGLVIGKSGSGIEEVKKELQKKILNKEETSVQAKKLDVSINVMEVSNPNLNAKLVMDQIIADLEKRMPYRRVMKQTISRVEKAGAKGVKVLVTGRLNGADIARTEMLSKGQLPLQTLRADVDYVRGAASTLYGQIGVKVWIYKGEVFDKESKKEEPTSGSVVKAKAG